MPKRRKTIFNMAAVSHLEFAKIAVLFTWPISARDSSAAWASLDNFRLPALCIVLQNQYPDHRGIVLPSVYSHAQQNALLVKICGSLTTEQKLRTQTATNLTWLMLSLPVHGAYRPQTTSVHPVLSWASASIFPQLYSCCPHFWLQSLLQVFSGHPLLLWPCPPCGFPLRSLFGNAVVISSQCVSKPTQFPSFSLVLDQCLSISRCCWFCPASVH